MKTLLFRCMACSFVGLLMSCSGGSDQREQVSHTVTEPSARHEVASSMSDAFTFRDDWVSFAGGPLIVIQKSALSNWEGAENFDNSILNGGTVRTDYDVICEPKPLTTIQHHERDMIVMGDSEWGARTGTYLGDVIIIQGITEKGSELVTICARLIEQNTSAQLDFDNQDGDLRLMAGADSGANSYFKYSDIPLKKGQYKVDVHGIDASGCLLRFRAQ